MLCVDPSIDMLKIAQAKDGTKPCLATADTFFTNHDHSLPKYNKILINESAHLFSEPQATFRKAFEYLPENGLLVLVTRSSHCTFPMWKALNEKFAPLSVEDFKNYLEDAGFKLMMVLEVGTAKMTKSDWYDKLRKRAFTVLSEFSDEEIEEGIQELDQKWLPNKKQSDVVEIRDCLTFHCATKYSIVRKH